MEVEAPPPPTRTTHRRSMRYRSWPVWLQWAVPFGVAIVLVVFVVAFVHHETDDTNQLVDNYNSQSAQVQENQEDTIIVKQQQAPRTFRIVAGLSPQANARKAVDKYMSHEIDLGLMDGPIKRSSCSSALGSASRLVLTCDVVASVVKYPFDVVVQPAAGTVTYCQRVAPPVPTMNIPVSPRCT